MKPASFLPLLAAAAVAASPQSSPPTFHETSQVDLVEIPVNVVGRDGRPMRDLTVSDFELEDEGRPQKITAFDVVDLRRNSVSPVPSEPMPEAARRHFLFLFDFSFATPNEIVHSRQAAMDFIERQMSPEDRAGIATTSVETGPRLLVNFTADRKQLAAAIRSLGPARIDEGKTRGRRRPSHRPPAAPAQPPGSWRPAPPRPFSSRRRSP